MSKIKCLFSLLILSLLHSYSFAQGEKIEMADALRQSGKIYVVVTVLLIILFGFIALLINIDRKLGKLEKQLK